MKALGRITFVGIVVSGALAFAGPAFAAIDTPPNGSTVALARPTVGGSGVVGSTIDVRADFGLGPNIPGRSTTTQANGRWSCTFVTPLATRPYSFYAFETVGGNTTYTTVHVTIVYEPPTAPTASTAPTEASLPVTPAGDAMPYLGAGLLLVLAGATLMLWVRSRRARRS